MSIELMCPACGSVNGFSEEQAGRMGNCGECSTPIYVPLPEEMRHVRLARGRAKSPLLVAVIAASSVLLAGLLGVGLFLWMIRTGPAEGKKGDDPTGSKDLFAAAAVVKLETNVASFHDAKIEEAKGEKMVKIKAPATGTLAVHFDADAGKTDGRLFAYDAAKKELVQNDADADRRVSQIFVPVEADREYYVKASWADDTATGPFKLALTTLTDVGNDFDRALELRLSRKGEATHSSKIDPPGDLDFFRFTAPFEGTLRVELKLTGGSRLDSMLTAHDATRVNIAADTQLDVNVPRIMRFYVESGKTYYVKVEAFSGANLDNRTGAYSLNFRIEKGTAPPPVQKKTGDSFATAQEVFLDNFGIGDAFGTINQPNEVQFFRLKAKKTGKMTVNLNYPPGSNLDATMAGYDSNRKDLGFNDFTLQLQVFAGGTYYIKVASKQFPEPGLQRTGGFELRFSRAGNNFKDDFKDFKQPQFADMFNAAQPLPVKQGAGSTIGQMNNNFDAHYYKIQPDQNGLMIFQVKPSPGSTLVTRLQVYDNFKLPIGLENSGFKELVVTAGSTYYAKILPTAALFGAPNVGGYQFSVTTEKIQPDDFGNDFVNAHELVLPEAGSKSINGRIEMPSDVDFFRFTAPDTGWMNVTCVQAIFSTLDQDLHCYDDQRREVGHPFFPVEKGRTYYAKASSWQHPLQNRRATGAYVLSVRFEKNLADDFGNDFDSASVIKIFAGLSFRNGRIETGDDVDFFRFQAASNGLMSIKLMRQLGSQLNGHLFVYDQDKNLIKDSDKDAIGFGNFPVPFLRQTNITVKFGQTYYIKVAPAKGAVKEELRGTYNLELDTNPPNNGLGQFKEQIKFPEKIPNPVKLAEGAQIFSIQGSLADNDLVDPTRGGYFKVYPVKMTQGRLYTIDIKSNVIDCYLRLEDSTGKELARDDDSGGGLNARIVFEPAVSGTYNVIGTSFGAGEIGGFSLQVHES